MHLIRLDFAASSTRSSRLGFVLLAIGVVLATGAVLDDSSQSESVAMLQSQLKRAKTAYARTQLESKRGADGISLDGFKQSDAAVKKLSTPWGGLLDVLEQAQNESIALMGIEPDSVRGSLKLSGEAKDLPALVGYMKSIDGKSRISAVRLLTQQVKQEDAQHPIVFVIEARWAGLASAVGSDQL